MSSLLWPGWPRRKLAGRAQVGRKQTDRFVVHRETCHYLLPSKPSAYFSYKEGTEVIQRSTSRTGDAHESVSAA